MTTERYFNYRTQEWDDLYDAPDDWSAYIPQEYAEQRVYELRQKLGESPRDAAIAVLRLKVGEDAPPLPERKDK